MGCLILNYTGLIVKILVFRFLSTLKHDYISSEHLVLCLQASIWKTCPLREQKYQSSKRSIGPSISPSFLKFKDLHPWKTRCKLCDTLNKYTVGKNTVGPYTLMTRDANSLTEVSKLPVFPPVVQIFHLVYQGMIQSGLQQQQQKLWFVRVLEVKVMFFISDNYNLTRRMRINS